LGTKRAIEFRNEIQRCALHCYGFKKIIDIVNGDVYIDAALSHIPNNKSVVPDKRAGRSQGGLS
jgi:hypothetical protein